MSNKVSKSLKIQSGINALLMVGGVLVVLVAIGWIGQDSYVRLDLTESEVNSLSAPSLDAVSHMEGLEIRLFKSKKMPKALEGPGVVIDNVPRVVQQLLDKLDEYKRGSDGNLTIKLVQDELEAQAGALDLVGLTIPQNRSEDADPDALNKRYYLGLAISYRRVEEVIPVLWNPGTFEYDITRALLRLRSKQAASVVMKDLLATGKELDEAVSGCLSAIEKHDMTAEKKPEDEDEGGILEQVESQAADQANQVDAYLTNLHTIDAACKPVGLLLQKQRDALKAQQESGRQVSQEHFERLLNQIGWFDGIYASWVASLINAKRDPALLPRLLELLKHREIPARTGALRVLASWLSPPAPAPGQPAAAQRPPLAGPGAMRARTAIEKGLSDQEPTVRGVALQVAVIVASEGARAEVLTAGLKDKDPMVREIALDLAMRNQIRVPADVVEPFLKDTDWMPRRLALAYLINSDQASLAQLRGFLADQRPELRFLAAFGLSRKNDTASTEKLRDVLQGLPPGNNRRILEAAIQRMGADPVTPEAAPAAPGAVEKTAPAPKEAPGVGKGGPAPEKEAPAAEQQAPGAEKAAPGAEKDTAPPGAPSTARLPGGPAHKKAPGGGLRSALGRAGLDRLGDMELMSPEQGVKTLKDLKGEINRAWSALKDSPGQKTLGFLCGQQELCPFADKDSIIPPQLAQAFAQQPFVKKAVDDILGLQDRMNQHNEAIRQFFLSKGYRIEKVEPNKPVPDNIDALVVYGPRRPFSDLNFYDLDQFVLTGKPVVLFVANWDVMVNQWDPKPPYNLDTRIESTSTNLDAFLEHYGVKNNKDLVMEQAKGSFERIHTVSVEMLPIGPVLSGAKYSYPLFPVLKRFSTSDPLVAGLRRVVMPFTSSFSPAKGAEKGLSFEPLMTTSEAAISKTRDFVLDPKVLKEAVTAMQTTGAVHVAAHVTGEATSFFAGGRTKPERPEPAASKDPNAPPPAPIKELARKDRGPVNLVVIGSTLGFEALNPSVILDGFNIGTIAQEKVTGLGAAIPYAIKYFNAWGRFIGTQAPIHMGRQAQSAQLPGQQFDFYMKNIEFLFGVFDWATGEPGLAGIRAKSDNNRPLEVVSDSIRRWTALGLVIGLPLMLVMLGFIRFGLRRVGRRRLG